MGLFLLWGAVGWCGTPWPGWFIWWLLHHDGPPPPDPEPWWDKLSGVIGGVVGGWLFTQFWTSGQDSLAIVAATSAVGAFVGSMIVRDVIGIFRGRQIMSRPIAAKGK